MAGETNRFGDYYVDSLIGEGGMGKVYRARQVKLDRWVALKVLPRARENKTFVERFYREARSAAKLVHPNIIQIYTVEDLDGIPFYAMEYIEGDDLEHILQTPPPYTHDETMETIRSVAKALNLAFEHGIVHRDIKPANIMLTKSGLVKVMDFGLAKGIDNSMTQAGLIVGTPSYMSPEQGAGKPVDGRSDIYSLGCVMYECLAGQAPYQADNVAALIYKHMYENPPAPSTFKQGLNPEMERICQKMMAKNVADRFQTARELLDALGQVPANSGGAEISLSKRAERAIMRRKEHPSGMNKTVITPEGFLGLAPKNSDSSTLTPTMPPTTKPEAPAPPPASKPAPAPAAPVPAAPASFFAARPAPKAPPAASPAPTAPADAPVPAPSAAASAPPAASSAPAAPVASEEKPGKPGSSTWATVRTQHAAPEAPTKVNSPKVQDSPLPSPIPAPAPAQAAAASASATPPERISTSSRFRAFAPGTSIAKDPPSNIVARGPVSTPSRAGGTPSDGRTPIPSTQQMVPTAATPSSTLFSVSGSSSALRLVKPELFRVQPRMEMFQRLPDGRWSYKIEQGPCSVSEGLSADLPPAANNKGQGLGDCLLCNNWNKRSGCAVAQCLDMERQQRHRGLKLLSEESLIWAGCGRFDRSIALLDTYIKNFPDDPEGYRELARVYERPDYRGRDKRRMIVLYQRFAELARTKGAYSPLEITRAEERAVALAATPPENKSGILTPSDGIAFHCFYRSALVSFGYGLLSADGLIFVRAGEVDPDTGHSTSDMGGAMGRTTGLFRRFKSENAKKEEQAAVKKELTRLSDLSLEALQAEQHRIVTLNYDQMNTVETSADMAIHIYTVTIRTSKESHQLLFSETAQFKAEQAFELIRRQLAKHGKKV